MLKKLFVLLIMVAFIYSCGNNKTEDLTNCHPRMKEIKIGMAKEKVIEILGTPDNVIPHTSIGYGVSEYIYGNCVIHFGMNRTVTSIGINSWIKNEK